MNRITHHLTSTPVRVAHAQRGGHAWIVLYTGETHTAIGQHITQAVQRGQLDWHVAAQLCKGMQKENSAVERSLRRGA